MAQLLIVVDMQNDFVTGHMSTPEARAAIGPIVEKIKQAQTRGDRVWFTLDTHLDADYGAADPTAEASMLPAHCIQGSAGWQVVPELEPFREAARTLEKPTFLGLKLADAIRGDLSGTAADVIELCGVCTDICVLSNALYLRAAFPKAHIVVDGRCCAGLNPQAHEAALTVLRSCLVDVQ